MGKKENLVENLNYFINNLYAGNPQVNEFLSKRGCTKGKDSFLILMLYKNSNMSKEIG